MVTKEEKQIIEQILEYCETGKTSMTDEIMHNPVSNYNDPKKLNAEINTLFREFPIIVAHVSELLEPGQFITHNDTGVEVGTGCTVFLRDMSPLGVTGFSDRAVFNPWKENDKDNYRWYAGLAIGAIGKLIRIEPETKHTSEVKFEVVDMVRTQSIQKRKDVHEKHALRKMTERPKYDLLADELPSDLQ